MIISLVNNKGGVLKTTIATNVSSVISMSEAKPKVVILDLDGQGNVAVTFGQHPERLENTAIDVFRGLKTVDDCLLRISDNFDVLPCNFELGFVDIDVAVAGELKKQKKFLSQELYTAGDIKRVILSLNKKYDYVILDTPPTMATIVSICLDVSDLVIIPFEPDHYSVVGLMRIINTIADFKRRNRSLKGLVVPTKVNTRIKLHNDVIKLITQKINNIRDVRMSNSFISLTTKPASAVGYERVPIVMSSVKSKYRDEYSKLAAEIINELKKT